MKPKNLVLCAALVAALLPFTSSIRSDTTAVVDLTPQLQNAGLNVDDLQAIDVGGIVVLRGRTTDAANAAHAGLFVQNLGYARVANLIRVIEPPDDAAIQRAAERRLAMHRALDDCQLRVDSNHGVVTVAGKVNSELQKDLALDVVRGINGVRAVKSEFQQR
jgi:osmotically-inducible protein OsmY